jgi:hypothetical protein
MSTDVSEAARTSETLVYIKLRTRQYIPEDSELSTGVTMTMDIILTITMLLLLCNNGRHICRLPRKNMTDMNTPKRRSPLMLGCAEQERM